MFYGKRGRRHGLSGVGRNPFFVCGRFPAAADVCAVGLGNDGGNFVWRRESAVRGIDSCGQPGGESMD